MSERLTDASLERIAACGWDTVSPMARELLAHRRATPADDLRAALEPFAKAAEIKLCGEWRDDQSISRTDVAFYITFGDLRRARAALSQNGGAA